MRITEIKSFLMSYPRDLHIIKIETDAGIYGVGEAGCSTREYGQEGVLRHFREFLVGMDPMHIEHIWQVLYRSAYYEGGRIITATMSAIDMALYDIVGKALRVPVYQLLGGACRDRVFGFRTVGALNDPKCAERVKEAVDEGWPTVRFSPADRIVPRALRTDVAQEDATRVFDVRESIAATAELFTEIHHVTDKRIALGIDYHHRLSVAEAAQFCQMIPRGSLAFLEEPIRNENPDAYAALRGMTDAPFAIGEEWSSKWAAVPYIERGLTNYARVDVCCIGGLTEAKKVAGWCETHYIDLMPHNPIGPVCTAATIHLAASINNLAWVEVVPAFNDASNDVFPVSVERCGPYYTLPTRPGLGIEFDETAAAKYPMRMHEHPHLQRPDGSYTNW
ncbi:MAG TPA: mandelate racemase/muconate lactonizing enzyme family protein [Candidatus Hydrogenedentes bacterium]|nr:mandelate racemase/muconate lactonizing enzyme family protein [Candidatus Hydrogenedentota bacterium]